MRFPIAKSSGDIADLLAARCPQIVPLKRSCLPHLARDYPLDMADLLAAPCPQIVPLKRSCLPHLARDYPLDMADLLAVSNYVDISCSATAHFRRAVTVKLPLPPLADTDDFAQDDMTVMHLVDDEWQLLEAPLKFTKSAVTFNTKSLARYDARRAVHCL